MHPSREGGNRWKPDSASNFANCDGNCILSKLHFGKFVFCDNYILGGLHFVRIAFWEEDKLQIVMRIAFCDNCMLPKLHFGRIAFGEGDKC